MKYETLLTTVGRAHDGHNGVVNMPAYRASTILFHDLADFRAGENGTRKLATYGRYGTPSTEALEESLAKVENTDHAIVTASGLSAIVTVLLAFLKAGDHVLMVDSVYGPVRRFCDQMLKRMNIEYTYYHPLIGVGIADLIQPNTKMVYVESPGSLTFEVQDVPAISKAAKAKGCIVVSDSTWATPFYQEPAALGIDVIIHSATKYISGHSDVIMGMIACNEEHYGPLLKTYRHLGATPTGDNCFFAQRGLRTMPARLKEHAANAMAVAQWLKAHPNVEEVIYPALPGSPGHELWRRDFTGATSLFAFVIKECDEAGLARMIDNLQYFGLGYSWGGYESLIIPFDTSHRKHIDWPYKGQCIRVHIGLEHVDDIIKDLEAGFKRLAGR